MENKKINIGLFTHKNADYDALCSTISLACILKHLTTKKLNVIPVIEPSPLIDRLSNKVKTYTQEEASSLTLDYAIICDVNEQDRTYGLDLISQIPLSNRYIIDHHDCNRVEIPALKNNRLIDPSAAATCCLITELLSTKHLVPDKSIKEDLYRGMASDSANFTRSVTQNTLDCVAYLNLSEEEKMEVIDEITRLSPRQQELYNKVESEVTDEPNLKIFRLLEPSTSTDIAIQVKNDKFDKLTGPTEEYPVSIFIIGYGNNYFAKLKKLSTCPIDILSIAIRCNGGGHETRCSGKFLNTTYLTVLETVMTEYQKETHKIQKLDNKNLIK